MEILQCGGKKLTFKVPIGILHSLLGAIFKRNQQPETHSKKDSQGGKGSKIIGTRNV